jgi:hypothetical protein
MDAEYVEAMAHLVGPQLGVAIPLRGNFSLANLRRHSSSCAHASAIRA